MEPQINYGGSSFNQQTPYGGQKIYGRSRFAGKGCATFVFIPIFLLVLILGFVYFGYPALTPNSIHGDFMDMALVPTKDGSVKLWVLTDGSFKFIQTTKSPGSYSTGVKCYFCKTWTYVYDPAEKKVVQKFKTEQNDVITSTNMIYSGGKVWVLTGAYGKNDAKIEAYDPETKQKVIETKDFLAKYPILSAGITGIRYDKKNNTMALNTRDGRDRITYSFNYDKLYEDYSAVNDDLWKDSTQTSVVALSNDAGSSQRKVLYKINGTKGRLAYRESSLNNYTPDKSGSKRYLDLDFERLTEKVYLEGILYFQDEDCAIIIHLDQLGNKSDRIVTCIDIKAGKEKWTVNQDDLFKQMRIDKDKDTFSDLFFTKDKIEAKRLGDLVIIQLKGEGILAFDYNTGKKLWEMSI